MEHPAPAEYRCDQCPLPLNSAFIAVTLVDTLKKAVLRRYRPINARDDLLEISGQEFDRILAQLELLAGQPKGTPHESSD